MVELQLRRRPNGSHYWRLFVGEKHRVHTELDTQQLDQAEELGRTAVRLAEDINRRFGYNYCPSGAYRAAVKAYRRVTSDPVVTY